MKRDSSLYVEDIVEALNRIEMYTAGMDLEEFISDSKTVDAVVRNLEIIGEAVKKIPEKIRKNYPGIQWREMAGMRDKLIHAYFVIDIEVLWKTVTIRIPDVKSKIKSLQRDLGSIE